MGACLMGVCRSLADGGLMPMLAVALLMTAGPARAGGDGDDSLRLDQQAYGLLRFAWGQQAHLNDIAMLRGDATCDGREDRVLGWLDRDSPEGLFYRVMLATDAVGRDEDIVALDGLAAVSVSLPADRQAAVHLDAEGPLLCSRGGLPEVAMTLELYAKAEAAALTGRADVCGAAIRLDDGLCDAVRLFWLRRPAGGARFVLHRY